MGLLPSNSEFDYRRLSVGGVDVDLRDAKQMRSLRGNRVSMVFQDAKAALDPVRTIGSQLNEPLRVHRIVDRKQRDAEVERLLGAVEIRRPAQVARQYPHELSGGMRQRAMIAMALAGRPSLLIADEPTSALDVTTQATVIDLIRRVGDDGSMATLLITHDLALVAGFAETVTVMYAGEIVEIGAVDALYSAPAHPYTRALLGSIPGLFDDRVNELGSIPGTMPDLTKPSVGCRFEPRCPSGGGATCAAPSLRRSTWARTALGCAVTTPVRSRRRRRSTRCPSPSPRSARSTSPVAALTGIVKTFQRGNWGRAARTRTVAVDGVDLVVGEGESVGIVGESGSGKTTLARVFVGLERADSGDKRIRVGDELVATATIPKDYVQFVFQDPGDSLDPMMSVGEIIAEPLVLRDGGRASRYRARVAELLEDVGLRAEMAERRPMELSGGQRQRVAIARALSTRPKVIIADEAVASLDMSARGQILNLFSRLQAEHGFAYLYISHDLSLVRHVCDRVVVMYGGQVMETASTDELFVDPRHPYTQALISAVPIPDPAAERARRLMTIRGEVGEGAAEQGCAFRTRCPIAQERCAAERPRLDPLDAHGVACHFAAEAAARYVRAGSAP